MLKFFSALVFSLCLAVPSYAADSADVGALSLRLEEIRHNLLPDSLTSVMAAVNLTKGLAAQAEAERSRISEESETILRKINVIAAVANETPLVLEQERTDLENRLQSNKIMLARIELFTASLNELQGQLGVLSRSLFWQDILTRRISLTSDEIRAPLKHDFGEIINRSKEIFAQWTHSLGSVDWSHKNFLPLILWAAIGLAAGIFIKRKLLNALEASHIKIEPTYARRLFASFYEAFAYAVLPALVMASIYFWMRAYDLLTHPLYSVMALAIWLSIGYIVVVSFARSVLIPPLTSWRLFPISTNPAKILFRDIVILTIISFAYLFFHRVLSGFKASETMVGVFTNIFVFLIGFGIIIILSPSIWGGMPVRSEAARISRAEIWFAMRIGILALIVPMMVIAPLGYYRLSMFVIEGLLLLGLLAASCVLLRGFILELIRIMLYSRLFKRIFFIKNAGLQKIFIICVIIVDFMLALCVVYIFLPRFGVSQSNISSFLKGLTSSVSIGDFTISPKNVLLSFLVFFSVLTMSKFLQGRIMSHATDSQVDENVKNSLSTGISYVGVILAIILAIATLGVSFTNIAIIAGALSVGIGFGLQNLVNNLVSGIIILIEQPIKVGDWVVIGDKQGIVRSIKIRATIIQTFQRAEIIVPNADVLASTLTNWTHTDNVGRVEVQIQVPDSYEPERIRDMLMEILESNPNILDYPPPFVNFVGIGENRFTMEARGFLPNIMDFLTVTNELRYAIFKKFKQENIPFATPHMSVHFPDSDKSAVSGRKTRGKKNAAST